MIYSFSKNELSLTDRSNDIFLSVKSKKELLKNFDLFVQEGWKSNQLKTLVYFCHEKKIKKPVVRIIQSILDNQLTGYPNDLIRAITSSLKKDYEQIGTNKKKEHFIFLHSLKYDLQKNENEINYTYYHLMELFKYTPTSLINNKYINPEYLKLGMQAIESQDIDKFRKIYYLTKKSLPKDVFYGMMSEKIVSTQGLMGWNFILENDPKIFQKKVQFEFFQKPIIVSLLLNAEFDLEELHDENKEKLLQAFQQLIRSPSFSEYDKRLLQLPNQYNFKNSVNKNLFFLNHDFFIEKSLNNLIDDIFYVNAEVENKFSYQRVAKNFDLEIKEKENSPLAVLNNIEYVMQKTRHNLNIQKTIAEKILQKSQELLAKNELKLEISEIEQTILSATNSIEVYKRPKL